MSNICDNTGFLDMMANRRYAFVYNVPPPRINTLDQSPYNKVNTSTGKLNTQYDLNMRRKAEVLKYSSNLQSTQTNNFTKNQRWAQISKGNYQRFSPSLYTQTTNPVTGTTTYTLNCNTNGIIQTPSYACDVPGPLTYLYEDPNVELYMYQSNIDAYALIPTQTPSPFIIQNLGVGFVIPNSNYNYTLPKKFSTVITTTGILNNFTVFTVSVPVAIRFMGNVSTSSNTVNYSFLNPALNVYYANTNQDNSDIPYDANEDPNRSYSVSGSYSSGVNTGTITFNVTNTGQPFGFDAYIGTVQFSSLLPLQTYPQFVYSFALSYIKLSNSVTLNGMSTNNYNIVINPPDPGSNTYYRNNVSSVTYTTPNVRPEYFSMTILYT